MVKVPLSDTVYIDEAANWSRELTRMLARGPGDTENAMRRIEREYGVAYGFIWSLRYRRDQLHIISHAVYERIKAAYYAECERQLKKLRHELHISKVTGANSDLVASAEAFLRENESEAP